MSLGTKASVVSNSGAGEWAWDPLISLPAVHLTKVIGNASQTLGNGTFTIYSVHNTTRPHDPATIVAVVGTEHKWEVSPATPVMKVGVQTYMMAAPPDAQPPASWFLHGTRWRKETIFFGVTVCEGVDDASLGLLEGILEVVAPYKESHKLADADQPPNAQEFELAVSAQAFLDSSFSSDGGVPKRKAGASEEAEAWLPVPKEDGGYTLKKPKHSVLGLSEVAEEPAAQVPKLQRTYTSKSAKRIADTSQRMASGILAAALWGSKKIMEAGEASKARTTPAAQPVQLSEGTLKRFEQTATAAGWVQRAADKVVSAVGSAAAFVVSKIISSKPRPEGAPISNKGQVAVAAAEGFTEVYAAIEEAAEVLYHSMRDSTSTVAGHKYGPDVGEATYHSLNAAGRGLDAWWSARRLGVKAVAKTTAKVVVKNYVGNLASNMSAEPAPSIA